ncbi:MAG: response regulator [Magnetococcales bacterium]|nr:response regulator [Magnetococcales bacterium]
MNSDITRPDERPVLLIVDDVPGNIKALMASLSQEYRVLVATSGPAALETAGRKEIDLILLDVVMPGMDGFEVCRRLKLQEATRDIPVIFVTAKQEEMDETRGFALGAVDYISKPINPAIVRVRVRTQIKIRTLNRNLAKSTQFIRQVFGRYMSEEVVDTILDTPEGLTLGGDRRLVTVMMTDLRGFTAMGERMTPEEVISMLNLYLGTMTEIIHRHKGTIIEFMGDGILAIFGTPIIRDDDAERAVTCGLEMQLAMPDVNARNRQNGYPEVLMGCGINTGQVVAGNIGSKLRSKYGVVGNAINLAARIESFTVGGQMLISESTMKACRIPLRIDDQWQVRAKGVSHPFNVYEIGGIHGSETIQLPKLEQAIPKPIANGPVVRLTILEGKRAHRNAHKGQMVAMLSSMAVVVSSLQTRRLTNLQVELLDGADRTITNQLYGKVVAVDSEAGSLNIQFTSIPPEAQAYFNRLV